MGEVREFDQEGTTGLNGPDAKGRLIVGFDAHRRDALDGTRDRCHLGGVEDVVAKAKKLAEDARARVAPSLAFRVEATGRLTGGPSAHEPARRVRRLFESSPDCPQRNCVHVVVVNAVREAAVEDALCAGVVNKH